MNALHRIHAALEPGGLVVDTQPVSAQPPVDAEGSDLGELDMREWRALIDEIDQITATVIGDGTFAIEHERDFVVPDIYDTGTEFLETVGAWKGTRIPDLLAERITVATTPVRVRQTIRLRVLRAR